MLLSGKRLSLSLWFVPYLLSQVSWLARGGFSCDKNIVDMNVWYLWFGLMNGFFHVGFVMGTLNTILAYFSMQTVTYLIGR
jgi:hypothetical protein